MIDAPGDGTERAVLAQRLAEALIFASAEPVDEQALTQLLVAQQALEPGIDAGVATRLVIEQLRLSCEGRGVTLARVAGGWQFRTAIDLAAALTRVMVRPRRLPRSAMETLSIIAYHQPCTRAEIETIRGVSLSQQTLDLLLEAALIVPTGRKEVPGRPTLWATSAAFLRHFGLDTLSDLPKREEQLAELPVIRRGPVQPDG